MANRHNKGKGKGQRKGKDPAVPRYEGTDGQCNICLGPFTQGVWTTRLACNRLFHEECWDEFFGGTDAECECPNCRGPPVPKAIFRHLGNNSRRIARQSARRMCPDDTASSSSFTDARSDVPRPQFLPAQHPTTATILVTAEQLAEWSMSWSSLSPEEHFRQQQMTSGDAGNATGERGDAPLEKVQEESDERYLGKN